MQAGRRIDFCKVRIFYLLHKSYHFHPFLILEPIGSSIPKFSTDDKSDSFSRSMGRSIALHCPAQGHPLPSFRLDMTST